MDGLIALVFIAVIIGGGWYLNKKLNAKRPTSTGTGGGGKDDGGPNAQQ